MHRVSLNHHILHPKNYMIIIDDVYDFNINSNALDVYVGGDDDVLDLDDNNKGMAVMMMMLIN